MSGPAPVSCDVLVVGAGPAGLAAGAALHRAGLEPTLIEAGEAVGTSWRGHYERVRLHTVKEHSALPYLPFPDDVPRYPSRLEVIAYLEAYAQQFGLAPRFGEEAQRIYRVDSGWMCVTTLGRYVAPDVVIATGYNRVPVLPTWLGMDCFGGTIRHSAAYRSADEFRGGRVLVVGIGNTGAEIALDLATNGAEPTISVRNPVLVVPRDFRGLPTQVTGIWLRRLRIPAPVRDWLGRLMSRRAFGDLSPYGLRRATYGPVTLIERYGRLPVVDIGTVATIKAGRIRIAPDLTQFTKSGVVFADGGEQPFDNVILATGYRPALDVFLEGAEAALDSRGYPVRGTGDVLGLHFVGYARPRTGMLREIAATAPRVAAAIVRSRAKGQR
jgi:indole-3-pyruvate monooxygenase